MTLVPVPGGLGRPPEPDWSQLYSDVMDIALAAEQWALVVREMEQCQTLALANAHMIERLVQYRVQYARASRDVAENGTIKVAKRTKVPQVNPYWAVMRQAGEEIRIIEVELGIPPVRRGKATKVPNGKKAPRAADGYLKAV